MLLTFLSAACPVFLGLGNVLHKIYYDDYFVFVIAYFVIVTALAASVAVIFRRRWVRPGRTRTLAIRLSLSLFSMLYLLVALEGVFAYAFVESDGFAFTLASRRWFHKYWHPINSHGFRAQEPVWKDHIVEVTGDSFVAGHGIERIEDRFPEVLGRKLGNGWTVVNIGGDGWGPPDYLRALDSYDHRPDVVVVSYFINDIEPAAKAMGFSHPQLRIAPPRWLAPIICRSSLLDWVYWRVYRRANIGETSYNDYLKEAFSREDIWTRHLAELDAIVARGKRDGALVVFVIWPDLTNVRGAAPYTARVAKHLRAEGVTVLDLADPFADRDPRRMIVNQMDAHPNEAVHAEVAQMLYEIINAALATRYTATGS